MQRARRSFFPGFDGAAASFSPEAFSPKGESVILLPQHHRTVDEATGFTVLSILFLFFQRCRVWYYRH